MTELAKSEGVLLLYNLPQAPRAGAAWQESDEGVLAEVEAVAAALDRLGHPRRPAGVRTLRDVPEAVSAGGERIVFNLVERLDGAATDFNFVPAVCAALGRSCTGGSADCLSLTFDKWLTKARLAACGIRTPAAAMMAPGDSASRCPALPVIVKPACADGSEGIGDGSVVEAPERLGPAVRRIWDSFGQPAMVEQYIGGREFNVSVLQRGAGLEVLPLAEIDFSLFPPGRPHVVDYAVKWLPGTIPGIVSPRKVPARVDPATAAGIRRAARGAWAACDCRDYVRVDMRLDAQGRAFVLEVNANPDVSPRAGYPAALAAGGVTFESFVEIVLGNAQARAALI